MGVALLYLGKRGAGVEFFNKISSIIDFDIFIFNEMIEQTVPINRQISYRTSESPLIYLTQYLFFYFVGYRKILDKLLSLNITRVVVPMANPFDLILMKKLKKAGVQITQIIHDANRHPGDIWPTKMQIRKMVYLSDSIICLSKSTKRQILREYPKFNNEITVVMHPTLELESVDIEENELFTKFTGNYFLLIGRIRKYKNFEGFIKSWATLNEFDYQLVVAGEGKIRLNSSEMRGIHVINRWLKKSEIVHLIRNSKVVVFPYLEGSQSGLIPICIKEKRWIITTEIPGLLEQTANYPFKIVMDFSFAELRDIVKSVKEFDKSGVEINVKGAPENGWSELGMALKESFES